MLCVSCKLCTRSCEVFKNLVIHLLWAKCDEVCIQYGGGLSVALVWYGHDFLPKAKPGSNQIGLHLSIVITIPPA
jgi:hypothetical protein